MAYFRSFLRQRRPSLLLRTQLVIGGFYLISSVSASDVVREDDLLPHANASSHAVTDVDPHTEGRGTSMETVQVSPPRLVSMAKNRRKNLHHPNAKRDCTDNTTLGDRSERVEVSRGCQGKSNRALPRGDWKNSPTLTAPLETRAGDNRADAIPSSHGHPLRSVREQNAVKPDGPTPSRRGKHRQTVLQNLSSRVKRSEDGEDFAGLRRLVGGWGGYPAFSTWYRARYLPWYYRMYGIGATPLLPTSPVVAALYQANIAAPQAAMVGVPVTAAPVATAPMTMAPMISAPVAATASPMLPGASVGVLPTMSPAPTEALLSLQEPSTKATLTAVPVLNSTPAALTTAPGISPAALTTAPGAYALAPSATVVTPAVTPVGINSALVTPSAAAAPTLLANTPVTLAAPAAMAVSAPTSSPTAVAAPAPIAIPSTPLSTSALLGAPASVAAVPPTTAVPAVLSAPMVAPDLPVMSNAAGLSRRSSGGVAGLGLANFAAFLARPDGTLAAVGGTGQ